MINLCSPYLALAVLLSVALLAGAQEIRLDLAKQIGPLEIDHMALGQAAL